MADMFVDPSVIASIRARTSIREIAGRYVKWDRKSDRGDSWAPCPFHLEKTASFHVRETDGRYKCFGCGDGGDVFTLLMRAEGLTFLEAVERLGDGATGASPGASHAQRKRKSRQDDARTHLAERIATASALWESAHDLTAADVPQIAYLEHARRIPRALIEHAAEFGVLRAGQHNGYASLFALMQSACGEARAIAVTRLRSDGSGKAAIANPRLTYGAVRTCAIRLSGPVSETLAIAEGMETALSFTALHGVPCWAATGASNLAVFEAPPQLRHLVIAADPGDAGMKAAHVLLDRLRSHVRVQIAPAPSGSDWNDCLVAEGVN